MSLPTSPISDKAVTIEDVARLAGTALSTASMALNGKSRVSAATRDAVFKAAQELGYEANYYAQRIKSGCVNTLACFTDTMSGVAGEKVILLQQEFIGKGFSAPLHGLGHISCDELEEAIKQLRRQRPRAIVFSGSPDKRVLDELRRFRDEAGIVVCYDNQFPDDFEWVFLDRETAAYQATRNLVESGHRDIGISTHNTRLAENPFSKGFLRAITEAGLTYRAEWDCPCYPFEVAGKELAGRFLTMLERPTAFYIVDDRVAASFVNHILRAGLQIPRDVSIVTHDQARVAEHCIVPLSVVSHPVAGIVTSVAEMVFSRLNGEYQGAPRHTVINGELIERGSVRNLS